MFVLFVTGRQSPDPIHQSYNWKNDSLKYEESQIREMSSWIQTSKQAFKPRTATDQNIDIITFSEMQKQGYTIIKAHSEQPFPKHPLLLIIISGGGTVKSYLINAIKILLKQSCAVTATT